MARGDGEPMSATSVWGGVAVLHIHDVKYRNGGRLRDLLEATAANRQGGWFETYRERSVRSQGGASLGSRLTSELPLSAFVERQPSGDWFRLCKNAQGASLKQVP
jgi:hypothetical protein